MAAVSPTKSNSDDDDADVVEPNASASLLPEENPDATAKNGANSTEPDGYDDSESLLNDMMNAESDEDVPAPYPVEVCTPPEAQAYRKRLHQVGLDQFVRETLSSGVVTAKKLVSAFGAPPPAFFDGRPDSGYFKLLGALLIRELKTRQKLPQYNTIDDAAKLLQKSNKIIVISGAGISTSLGIPDFRSKGTGFYDKMRAKGFENGEEIFSIELFQHDPTQFYENAGDTLPHMSVSSPTHAFIKLLQDKGKLLTNYTQNIDNIEGNAGISPENLIQCHGSWATATCQKCRFQVSGSAIFDDVRAERVPKCLRCIEELRLNPPAQLKRKRSSNSTSRSSKSRRRAWDDDSSDDSGQYDIPQPGVMKPDITFFGENLPSTFFQRFKGGDRYEADLVVVIGTSMNVAPVAEIPAALEPDVPQIYISRTECKHISFDVTLLGDCDVVVAELAKRAGWNLEHRMLPKNRDAFVTAVREEDAIWSVHLPEQIATPESELEPLAVVE